MASLKSCYLIVHVHINDTPATRQIACKAGAIYCRYQPCVPTIWQMLQKTFVAVKHQEGLQKQYITSRVTRDDMSSILADTLDIAYGLPRC